MKYIELLEQGIKKGDKPSKADLETNVEQAHLRAQNYLNELKMKLSSEKASLRGFLSNPNTALEFEGIVSLKKSISDTEELIKVSVSQIEELF